MKFSQFLKIMNCYIGQEKSQYDFMYSLFSMIVCEPFSEEEMKSAEEDEYYPFSNLCGESQAKKVYSGDRVMPKALARFAHSHFDAKCLINLIEDMSDEVKENLCADFDAAGVECNLDDVANVVSDIFRRFITAAIEENDTIDVRIKAETEIRVQSGDATNHEVLLLEETENTCPLCGCQLLRPKKNKVVKRYKVVRIFPDNLKREDFLLFNKVYSVKGQYDSDENLITLCTDCALDYEADVSLEEFKKLVKIKKTLSQQNALRQSLEGIDIEAEISIVISALLGVTLENKFVDLSLQALRVEQKIDGKYGLLINTISNDVVHYYKYIEEQFGIADSYQTNSFERIASEVRLAFEKLEGNNLPQDQMFSELVNWMMRKLEFENRHRQAVSIVVAFFVQNCEVFREISK